MAGTLLAAMLAVAGGRAANPAPRERPIRLEPVARGLDRPVFATSPPGDERLFVLEQPGRVVIVRPGPRRIFLDLDERVLNGGERGLLGLAFHPDYASNRRLYVHYTDHDGDTRVEEYRASRSDPDRAVPEPTRVLFTVDQPRPVHNGGMLAFGPDEALYLALGDGGPAGEPPPTAADPASPLGAILRMDTAGRPPPGNPHVGGPGHPLVWAHGLRNPWRFAFDGDRMVIADVGRYGHEELNVVPLRPGLDLGWPAFEGPRCVAFAGTRCDRTGRTFPVLSYRRAGGACAVVGGFVYRGGRSPSLRGHYLYSDHCAGFLRSVRLTDGSPGERVRWSPDRALSGVTSFGVDAAGEVYVTTLDGNLHHLVGPRAGTRGPTVTPEPSPTAGSRPSSTVVEEGPAGEPARREVGPRIPVSILVGLVAAAVLGGAGLAWRRHSG